jgi:3-oxoacyl-[acyl-carrier protein] reductase
MASGLRALVTGSEAGFGRAVASGLGELGLELVRDDPVALVVHAAVDPFALEPRSLADTSLEDWQRSCDAVLRSALECAQAAYRSLHRSGGVLVFVTPTVGITGAAHLVAYAAAVEGVRALAKSAARQWGGAGIRVNCVAPRVELLAPDGGSLSPDVAEPALGAVPADARAVASAIALLASEGFVVTGATIVVDGGVVMIP